MDVCLSQVISLYHRELGKSVKIAHKLSHKALYPLPIERSKVELADKFFHESTINGLEFYGEIDKPEWLASARFLRIIRKWWDICNVRSACVGVREGDKDKEPISNEKCQQIRFLNTFAAWLKEWSIMPASSKSALSKETFECAIQTSEALPKLCENLLTEKKFDYVLLGKITSDPIERRFGRYRQLHGGNYYLGSASSLRQRKNQTQSSCKIFQALSWGHKGLSLIHI